MELGRKGREVSVATETLGLVLNLKTMGSAKELAPFHFGLCSQTLLQYLYIWMMAVEE